MNRRLVRDTHKFIGGTGRTTANERAHVADKVGTDRPINLYRVLPCTRIFCGVDDKTALQQLIKGIVDNINDDLVVVQVRVARAQIIFAFVKCSIVAAKLKENEEDASP